jgi:hypothetical protein
VTASSTNLPHSWVDFGVSRAGGVWRGILNRLAERAEAAVDRTRLATLPLRYLDDVAMTVGERDAILGYETPERDPWTLITIQRL